MFFFKDVKTNTKKVKVGKAKKGKADIVNT